SGPAVMPLGRPLTVGSVYSVNTPPGVSLPILFALASVNQRLPSGPRVMPATPLAAVGIGYSVKTPAVDTFPIRLWYLSVNQRLPSGPVTIGDSESREPGI